jgi:3'(2'), 5'-bisphosphate nucleotidase
MPAQAGRYAKERTVAELAVQRATILTKKVFKERHKGTLSKSDRTPVTVGDFGSQALVIKALNTVFPEDGIVAEEEAQALREDESLRRTVWEHVSQTRLGPEAEAALGGAIESIDEMVDLVDRGKSNGGAKGRHWVLDPIDGTKGFIRGAQYAVCLALIVDGEVTVGVIGCPNLPVKSERFTEDGDYQGEGSLFSAIASQGAIVRPLGTSILSPESYSISARSTPGPVSYCDSYDAAHAAQHKHSAIATRLGITSPPIRVDSQVKYMLVAYGAADIYLRLQREDRSEEWIWDHAAGDLIARESGGEATDSKGRRLDFSKGRTLAANSGVIVASRQVHPLVLQAV